MTVRRALDRPPLALRLATAWSAACAVLVPADRRRTFRDQWAADLWHYSRWMAGRYPEWGCALRLLARASTALTHALTLRCNLWSFRMLLHDLRFAWRLAAARPAFSAVAVLVLALGIGANATIFAWVETVLLHPLPGVPDQDRIVALRGTTPTRQDLSFSYLNFVDLRSARPSGFDDVIAFRAAAMNLRADAEPIRVWGQIVTDNFFDVLRVPPALGRTFGPGDAPSPGREPVVVLGHRLWRRAFGASPDVVGRSVTLNGSPFTIVGVAPEGFQGSVVGLSLDLFVPITMQTAVLSGDRLSHRGNSFLQVFGRLAAGASLDDARASTAVVAARLAADHPVNRDRGIRVVPLHLDGASGLLRPVMATLMAVVGIVLLIACANLAGLLLARASGREREIAVRLAVGANRARLVRQLLVESLLLAAAGGALGIALSHWTSGLLTAFVPRTPMPVGFSAGLSPLVVLFTVGVTLAATIAFGLVPALRASRADVVSALKASAGSIGAPRGRLRQGLVAAQVAMSMLLLVCAALFGRSLVHARSMDPGFSTRDGLIAAIDLLPNGYSEARGLVFFEQLLERLAGTPGVLAASVAAAMPLDLGSGSDMMVRIDGYQLAPGEEISVAYNRVGPGYFAAMGLDLVRGRAIEARDRDGSRLVVVINETMAAKYWAGRDPLGGRVDFGNGPATVVGVARDGRYGRLNEEPRNYMYVPLQQFYRPDVLLLVKTSGDPAALASAVAAQVRALDANLPLFDVRTYEEHLRLSLFIPRLAGTMLGLFGALALLLTIVGLYSVVAFTVTQRTREIGIRMALGAAAGSVVRMIIRQGLVIAVAGLAVGVALAAVAARLLAGQLTGISWTDPVSFAAAAAGLVLVAVLACLVPARRAARMDPLQSLRWE